MSNKFKTFSKRVLISIVTIIVAIQLLDIPITSALASMGVRTSENSSESQIYQKGEF